MGGSAGSTATIATTHDLRADVLAQLVRLAPVLEHLRAEGLRKRRLTRPRARLLRVLADGGPLVMCDISRALDVTPRAVTGLVDGLEADGLVRRVDHPSDRRATIIELTPLGRRLCREMREGLNRFADELLAGVTRDDLAASLRVLDRCQAAFETRAD